MFAKHQLPLPFLLLLLIPFHETECPFSFKKKKKKVKHKVIGRGASSCNSSSRSVHKLVFNWLVLCTRPQSAVFQADGVSLFQEQLREVRAKAQLTLKSYTLQR